MALSVSVPANADATATARVRLVGASDAQCRVELEDYPVTFDNIYNYMLRPSSKIQVLDIAAQEAPATQRLYGNEPLFSYRRVSANGLNYPLVDAANVVVVQGQQELSASLRESLRRVVQRGGSVVVVPDADSKGRASYDLLFRELGVGPILWENANGPTVAREVATPDRRNPFFRDVFGVQSRQPAMPKAAPVLRWSRSGMDLLRLQDGEGFLASFGSGKGTVYLFSTPFDAARTDFPQHALFVPVMYKLAMQSLRQEQPLAYQLTQGSITVPVELGSGQREQVFKLTQDSLTYIPGQRLQAGQLHLELPAAMREPGFYTLTNGGRTVTTLAFNNDKRESELAVYSADELRELIGPNRSHVQVYDASQGQSVAARYKAERVGTPLWQYCLWAALICLLAEVLLLRFVNQTKPVPAATTVV